MNRVTHAILYKGEGVIAHRDFDFHVLEVGEAMVVPAGLNRLGKPYTARGLWFVTVKWSMWTSPRRKFEVDEHIGGFLVRRIA